MRLTAAEKAEVIRLVEGSELLVRRTLAELGVHRSTFYAWYRRYAEAGAAGLVAQNPPHAVCANLQGGGVPGADDDTAIATGPLSVRSSFGS